MPKLNDSNIALIAADIINGLFLSPNSPALLKGSASALLANPDVTGAIASNFIQPRTTNGAPTTPKAFINYIFFDDQLNYVSAGVSPVPQGANTLKQHYADIAMQQISAPKNGFVYIFCSNESPVNVYFDNLQVIVTHGKILEETHYYPFGLTMAGISSAALKRPENRIKFQGQELASKEFSDGSGLNTYEFKWRMHDPQIGRFWQIDPLADKYPHNITYAFSENKVTNHMELEGLESVPGFNMQDLWRSAGISQSSDPNQFVLNALSLLLEPKTWFEGYAKAGQIAVPFALVGIMTGGFGEGAVFEAELQTMRSSSLVVEEVGEQWGQSGLYSSESRTTTLLGTRRGYWGTVTSTAEETGLNLVANDANPGGYSYLNVELEGFDFSTAAGRQSFFNSYNQPFLDAAIKRGDKILMLDNPYNARAIFYNGEKGGGFNFYGMEKSYLESRGFTFVNGEAVYPAQSTWHPPMAWPMSY